jgi:glycosyltransferase involved in cell wall biosynthesis
VLTRFAVVVPAHDEEELLPSCLDAVSRAALTVSPRPVQIVVVADACTDGTAEVAHSRGAHVVTVDVRNVGAARAAGTAYAMRSGPEGLWLATTDADSRVPTGWLRSHRAHAKAGAELVVGTVTVDDWTPWPAGLGERHDAHYRAGLTPGGHRHVHGANLGYTALAYAKAGGFAALPHDEDRDLVARMTKLGARVVRDPDLPVVTSSRPAARAPGGFATFLSSLTEAAP